MVEVLSLACMDKLCLLIVCIRHINLNVFLLAFCCHLTLFVLDALILVIQFYFVF